MADQQLNLAGAAAAMQASAGTGIQPFDLQRFGMEVAGEIGVDPNNLGAYGLSQQQLRAYETRLHSGTQRGGGSR